MEAKRIEHSRRTQLRLDELVAGYDMQWLWSVVYFLACLESTYSHLALFQENEVFRQAVSVFTDFGYLLLIVRVTMVVLTINDKKRLLPLAVAAATCSVGVFTTGNTFYIKAIILIVASSGMELRFILRASLLALISAFLLGILSLLFIDLNGVDIRALGYSQKNQAGLAVFLICAQYILLELSYSLSSGGYKAYIALGIAAAISITIGSKTALISIMMLCVGVIALDVAHRIRIAGKCLFQHVSAAYSVCMVFSILTAVMLPLGGLLFTLDHVMTNRVWLNWYALNNRPVTLFGSNADITAGTGTVYSFVTNTYNNAITIDNSYIISIILMGIVPSVVYCALHYFTMRSLSKRNWDVCILIGVILCTYGLMESQMIDPVLNFVLMVPFVNIRTPKHLSVNNRTPKHLSS